MSAIDDLPPLREVIRRTPVGAQIARPEFPARPEPDGPYRACGRPLEMPTVIEIGPGPGGLTRALLARAPRGYRDRARRARVAALAEIAKRYPDRLTSSADAYAFDPRPLLGGAGAKIVANLPYNIATALLIDWLALEPWPPWYDTMVLMFQREVAERIVAGEDDEAYGRLACSRTGAPRPSPVRHLAGGLRAAAQGHVFGGASVAAPSPEPASADARAVAAAASASAGRCCGRA